MKIKVFISSVQKELEDERLSLQILLTTDPFLSEHCVPILYEYYPSPLKPQSKGYLELLSNCQLYLGIIGKKYGNVVEDDLSATHSEYEKAQDMDFPTLIAIKGKNATEREDKTKEFIKEIKDDDHKYERFENIEELQNKVRKRLIKHIKDTYHLEPTADEEEVAKNTIQVASSFERQRLKRLCWNEMDKELAKKLVAESEKMEIPKLDEKAVIHTLWQRGYLWEEEDKYYGTAAGIFLFGNNPTAVFTHARIQIAAFPGIKKTHKPIDHDTIRKPLPIGIDEAVAFVNKNTKHPLRVIGLNRVQVDEYPEEAIREALVNALAHRDYEDAGRRIEVNLFKDRIEIISPGDLPGGLSIKKLLSGQAKSRSRNPNIAQGLNLLGRMEERGTGIQRMTEDMLNHGLDKPDIKIIEDEVNVILYGPGDNLDRIKTPRNVPGIIPPAMEEKLNRRQRKMVELLVKGEQLTSRRCRDLFKISGPTAASDLKTLVQTGIARKVGKGRSTHYILDTGENNR